MNSTGGRTGEWSSSWRRCSGRPRLSLPCPDTVDYYAHGMIIDCHTHAFPDDLAARAIHHLEQDGEVEACLDGTIADLLRSMSSAGVDRSVVASIATKPEQFDSIIRWSRMIASDRIVPFPSVHPDDAESVARISQIKEFGFVGVKLHPYYQSFRLDEPRISRLIDQIEREGLVLLLHAGFDIAFPRDPIATPQMVRRISDQHPNLKLIASHFGGWEEWGEVERLIIGREIYIDTSYSIPMLGIERARDLLARHPADYVLFGSDSPWGVQAEDLRLLREIVTDGSRLNALLGENCSRLIGT